MRSGLGPAARRIQSRNTSNYDDEYFNWRFSGNGCVKIDQQGVHLVELVEFYLGPMRSDLGLVAARIHSRNTGN